MLPLIPFVVFGGAVGLAAGIIMSPKSDNKATKKGKLDNEAKKEDKEKSKPDSAKPSGDSSNRKKEKTNVNKTDDDSSGS